MKTSDGYEWTELQTGYWRDESTGLIWGPVIGEFTFDEAQKKASEIEALLLKWTVPTRKEWLMAEIHDVREVLPDIERLFWSSSPDPTYPYLAYVFYGDDGSGAYDYGRYGTLSVRCCGR